MSGLDDILGKVSNEEPDVEEYPFDGMCGYTEDGETCFWPLETLMIDRSLKKAYVACMKDHVQNIPWEMVSDG